MFSQNMLKEADFYKFHALQSYTPPPFPPFTPHKIWRLFNKYAYILGWICPFMTVFWAQGQIYAAIWVDTV